VPETAIAGVEARIAELVQAHRPEVERLVREQFDRLAAELVDLELARRGNGAVTGATPTGSHPLPTQLCARCGQRPRSPGRTVCSRCRHARARERQVQPADLEPPHPGRGDHGD
jgi:hypothetical protein